mgnify:CR=1 FL=1
MFSLLAATPAFAQDAAPATVDTAKLEALLKASDVSYDQRDQPGKWDEAKAKIDEAEKLSPKDYGLLWRMSRALYWKSDGLTGDEQMKLGKASWDYGEKAIAANLKGVEGYYYAALGMGNYSLGIGILKALSQGIEGKYRDRLGRAGQIDAKYDEGGIDTAWGRFYFKLPWPKYDEKKSEAHFKRALQTQPAHVRARVYYAELLLSEKRLPEAKKLVKEALAHQPGAYDLPEEKRAQAWAKQLQPKIEAAADNE